MGEGEAMTCYFLFGFGVWCGLVASEFEVYSKRKSEDYIRYLLGFFLTVVFPFAPLYTRIKRNGE